MPLDVLGRTRATLMDTERLPSVSASVSVKGAVSKPTLAGRSGQSANVHRDGDRCLQLFIFNEEFLVSACHQHALITSLPFVHTARRYYRLNGLVRFSDCAGAAARGASQAPLLQVEKSIELDHLEEVKVVTRFP